LQKHQAEGNSSEGNAPSLARDLCYWTAQRASGQLTPILAHGTVKFGCRVTVERSDGRKRTYRLV
jgi:transcription elongation GreA/GreB family factor